jgi:ectoine hydroxylase-related dioxygenase (phytanoyl-CoA dioxygenase family)
MAADPTAQREFFEKNGYLVVDQLLDAAALAELRAMVDGVLDGTVKPQAIGGAPASDEFQLQMEPAVANDPAVPRRDKIRVAFHLCHNHPFFWGHVTRPEILNVVSNLMGPDLKLYTDQLFVKPAHHGSEVGFHQDSAYWLPLEPHNLVSCWVALDDSTVQNGCVHVIPGSHHKLLPHHDLDGPQSLGLLEDEVDVSVEVPVEIKAGGAMFHHSCLIHRSFPNRSDKGRRGLVAIYLPSDLQLVKPWDFEYGWKVVSGSGTAK